MCCPSRNVNADRLLKTLTRAKKRTGGCESYHKLSAMLGHHICKVRSLQSNKGEMVLIVKIAVLECSMLLKSDDTIDGVFMALIHYFRCEVTSKFGFLPSNLTSKFLSTPLNSNTISLRQEY